MKEVTGNLWTYPADVRVITTNGTVKKNGECVMGRGCAREAKAKFPTIAQVLGESITNKGNHVHWLYGSDRGNIIFSFPVKHAWYQTADLALIERSAKELMEWMPKTDLIKVVVVPRPGCGNGKLDWETQVKPILAPILDDRFHIISPEG